MNDIETNTRENFPYPKTDSETRSLEERWHLLGTRVPKAEIVYFSQMVIVYVIIITSITNLSLQNGSTELWISLLSSCIGYALPNPKLKLEDLKVLRRSPDLLNNVKIGQGQLQLIMEQILFSPYTFWSSDLNNLMNNPSNSPVISEKKMFR